MGERGKETDRWERVCFMTIFCVTNSVSRSLLNVRGAKITFCFCLVERLTERGREEEREGRGGWREEERDKEGDHFHLVGPGATESFEELCRKIFDNFFSGVQKTTILTQSGFFDIFNQNLVK